MLPSAPVLSSPAKEHQAAAAGDTAPATQRDKAVADNKLVRTDARARTMDAFVSRRSFGDRESDPARAAAAAVAAGGTALARTHLFWSVQGSVCYQQRNVRSKLRVKLLWVDSIQSLCYIHHVYFTVVPPCRVLCSAEAQRA